METERNDAVRCAGITTNEVLNLNKLQGVRHPLSARLSFGGPSTPCSLKRLIPCQLIQNSRGDPAPRNPAGVGRTPRTRNGDMNIPAVEYRRVVNLFVREENEEGGSVGWLAVLGGETTLFSRLERIFGVRTCLQNSSS